jgi:single-stranded-DNA-specific exonuclease
LLAQRGIESNVEAQAFFGESRPLAPDPLLLPDMNRAVSHLRAAIDSDVSIAVHGDFDVDGITATAILTEGLRDLGARVTPFIPNRFSDGYGVTEQTLGRLAASGHRLVITVDCGISAVRETAAAREAGVQLIILDHHEVGPELPAAVAVVDPKRTDSHYPTHDLCSGALALRLLQALYALMGKTLDEDHYVDVAALATVCDMVPLRGENRHLVQDGLRALAKSSRPGLRALLSGEDNPNAPPGPPKAPDVATLGYRLGPRINAAGRLADASIALELLLTHDEARAAEIAGQLHQLNLERRRLVDEAVVLAAEIASSEPDEAAAIVVGHERISRGIVGIVASRLVEMYHRPAFVFEHSADGCVGSARATPGFDVVHTLGEASAALTRHGGHRAAGGFALPAANVAQFKAAILHAASQQLCDAPVAPPVAIDADCSLRAIDRATIAYLSRFEPCGMGNPAPVMASRNVLVRGRKSTGDGRHLLLNLRDGPVIWPSFAFERGDAEIGVGAAIDIVYSVENGSRGFGPRLRLLDWRNSNSIGAAV